MRVMPVTLIVYAGRTRLVCGCSCNILFKVVLSSTRSYLENGPVLLRSSVNYETYAQHTSSSQYMKTNKFVSVTVILRLVYVKFSYTIQTWFNDRMRTRL